jgi:AmiR/NasT family two-component response regulator
MQRTETKDVVIAEDDALLNDGIARQLLRLGYTPAGQAYDGAQAVELACQTRPGLVLMDLQMIDPETGREDAQAGLKAARAIQERCPAAVVVLSAHESPDMIRQASEAGVSAYLVKPAGDGDLDRALTIARARFKELLRWRRLADELHRRHQALSSTLSGKTDPRALLALCAWCKKIQDDAGRWQAPEVYMQKHLGLGFSHGVCPECFRWLMPTAHSNPESS